MKLRVATFNMENLFTRPSAMADGAGAKGQAAIDDHATLNSIVAKDLYSDHDKAILLDLARRYGFAALNPPSNALVLLNKVRGQLYSMSRGVTIVKAKGRGDWTGWFELRMKDIKWTATYNTGRVVAEISPDILVCVEVESRPTVVRFNEQVLKTEFHQEYPHVMVIDGNDMRGIDVGVLSRYPINGIRSHVDDTNPTGELTFSRDCPEYVIQLTDDKAIVVIPNHFKSKRGGDSPTVQARRLAQASAASAIAKRAQKISPHVLVAGDLNDTPDSATIAPLLMDGFADVMTHPSYPKERPGTYETGTAKKKIDYLIMSPALQGALQHTGIERRGSYHPNTWTPFDTVKNKADEASDHHLVWADFEI